mmetsp:Transcript_118182/g.329592  ORF Transcript_118182/g.329592 Transcript_118182/m.329592 type:complete len:283 (-) Transcript_118182:1090-1938(-)
MRAPQVVARPPAEHRVSQPLGGCSFRASAAAGMAAESANGVEAPVASGAAVAAGCLTEHHRFLCRQHQACKPTSSAIWARALLALHSMGSAKGASAMGSSVQPKLLCKQHQACFPALHASRACSSPSLQLNPGFAEALDSSKGASDLLGASGTASAGAAARTCGASRSGATAAGSSSRGTAVSWAADRSAVVVATAAGEAVAVVGQPTETWAQHHAFLLGDQPSSQRSTPASQSYSSEVVVVVAVAVAVMEVAVAVVVAVRVVPVVVIVGAAVCVVVGTVVV